MGPSFAAVGDSMNPDEPEADETTPEEEEWQLMQRQVMLLQKTLDDLVEVKDDEDEENGSMGTISKPMDKL